MRIVSQMTGGAILPCHSKFRKAVSAAMAIHTCRFSMLTAQLEGKGVMREIGDHAVVTVVAVQARLAVGKEMIHHESLVALSMTRLTGIFVKCRYIAPMAIRTFQRFVFRLELMRR